jgi:hypothetical protein
MAYRKTRYNFYEGILWRPIFSKTGAAARQAAALPVR